MRLGFRLVWLVGSVVLANAGCIEVYNPPAVLDLVIEDAAGQLEGVQVCEGDTGHNCAVSDANGRVTLEVPVGQEILYTLQKDGYDSFLFADVVPESGFSSVWYLNTNAEAAESYEGFMSPYPRGGTGQIQIFLSPGFAGATFDLVDATGNRFYEATPYEYPYVDPDLEATTAGGAGAFVEVAPGTFQIDFGGTAEDCVPGTAWPGNKPNSVRVPVRGDHNSIVFVNCPLPR
jgi:hypothetical protein